MATERWDEVERTFDVGEEVVLPTLAGIDGVATMDQPVEQHLEAVYFDTSDLVLARRGVTLRRRTGGEDAGWHLKLPAGKDTRTELRRPLGRATRTPPRAVLDPVRALVRDHRLAAVARISNRRLEHVLRDGDGAVLAVVCDDHVTGERVGPDGEQVGWREWEVELAGGDSALLDAVEQRLAEAGAVRSTSPSKLRRVLGGSLPASPPAPSHKALRRGPAADVVLSHLTDQVAELHRQDQRVRAGSAAGVHKMRIAARRLRSALRTYSRLLDADAVGRATAELRWLGRSLAAARDAQVLRERWQELVSGQPTDLVLGPVRSRLDDELRAAEKAGQAGVRQALGSERYFRLLDDLDALLDREAFTTEAAGPARMVLPALLHRDVKRLRRTVAALDRAEDPDARNLALHDVRKKGKRLRYAAESMAPVLGKRARRLAAAAKRLQQSLGRHQDTVMSRQRLREYGARTHVAGENGFTYGRLHALEEAHAAAAERDFQEAWRAVPRKDPRRWS